MDGLTNGITKLGTDFKTLAVPLAILSLIVIGITLIVFPDEGSRIKRFIFSVIIGLGIVMLSGSIIFGIAATFGG